MTRDALVLASLIGAIGVVYVATLRPGQEWGDDFSLYVAHARNLAEGRPYADTGYVYNPANPVVSPRSYPPIFPLLLVPVYLLWGLNLSAMKIWTVMIFLALLSVLAVLLSKRLPLPYVAACLILFALNPYVWQQKDRLLSETPFMLFAYLTLLLGEKALHASLRREMLFWGLAAGTTAYLAFGTRTVGVVLLPSLLVCEWLWRRRLSFASAAMVAAFGTGVAVQKCLLVVEGSYLDQLVFDTGLYLRIARSQVLALGMFLENGTSKAARLLVFACLLAPTCWTWGRRLRDFRGITSCELFFVFNALVIMLWPAAEYDQRFLLPVLPLFFLWVAEGLHQLAATSFRRLEKPIAATLALAVLLSYAGHYSRIEAGPIREGVNTPEAVALFTWVRQETDPHDLFVFQKPRAFALYTGRQALAHHREDDGPRLARTLSKHGATHVVVNHGSTLPIFEKSRRLVETFRHENPSSLEKVYENPSFRVYRLREGTLASR